MSVDEVADDDGLPASVITRKTQIKNRKQCESFCCRISCVECIINLT